MPSTCLAPGLFGFPGMPATAAVAAHGSWYGKGPHFQAGASQALSEGLMSCASSQAPDSVILQARALMMPTRHFLTTKPGAQRNQDAPPSAQCACTTLQHTPSQLSPPPRLSTLPHHHCTEAPPYPSSSVPKAERT